MQRRKKNRLETTGPAYMARHMKVLVALSLVVAIASGQDEGVSTGRAISVNYPCVARVLLKEKYLLARLLFPSMYTNRWRVGHWSFDVDGAPGRKFLPLLPIFAPGPARSAKVYWKRRVRSAMRQRFVGLHCLRRGD